MVTNGELAGQLAQANENLEALRLSVDELEKRERTSKRLSYSIALVLALTILLGIVGFFESQSQRQRVESLTRDLFAANCEAGNETRQEIRDSNMAQAEAILEVAGTDERDPELADTYRAAVRKASELIVDRDCDAAIGAL